MCFSSVLITRNQFIRLSPFVPSLARSTFSSQRSLEDLKYSAGFVFLHVLSNTQGNRLLDQAQHLLPTNEASVIRKK